MLRKSSYSKKDETLVREHRNALRKEAFVQKKDQSFDDFYTEFAKYAFYINQNPEDYNKEVIVLLKAKVIRGLQINLVRRKFNSLEEIKEFLQECKIDRKELLQDIDRSNNNGDRGSRGGRGGRSIRGGRRGGTASTSPFRVREVRLNEGIIAEYDITAACNAGLTYRNLTKEDLEQEGTFCFVYKGYDYLKQQAACPQRRFKKTGVVAVTTTEIYPTIGKGSILLIKGTGAGNA